MECKETGADLIVEIKQVRVDFTAICLRISNELARVPVTWQPITFT